MILMKLEGPAAQEVAGQIVRECALALQHSTVFSRLEGEGYVVEIARGGPPGEGTLALKIAERVRAEHQRRNSK